MTILLTAGGAARIPVTAGTVVIVGTAATAVIVAVTVLTEFYLVVLDIEASHII